jgi:hypothetical protein
VARPSRLKVSTRKGTLRWRRGLAYRRQTGIISVPHLVFCTVALAFLAAEDAVSVV